MVSLLRMYPTEKWCNTCVDPRGILVPTAVAPGHDTSYLPYAIYFTSKRSAGIALNKYSACTISFRDTYRQRSWNWATNPLSIFPSRHMTLIQLRSIKIGATSWRCIDINAILYRVNSTLYKHHAPARQCPVLSCTKRKKFCKNERNSPRLIRSLFYRYFCCVSTLGMRSI